MFGLGFDDFIFDVQKKGQYTLILNDRMRDLKELTVASSFEQTYKGSITGLHFSLSTDVLNGFC